MVKEIKEVQRIHASLAIVLLAGSLVACSQAPAGRTDVVDQRPSRSECMVRISPGSSETVKKINPDTYFFVKTFVEAKIPVAANSFDDEGGIYVLFSERCKEREAMARTLMADFYGTGAEGFTYQAEGIIPNTKTIMAGGNEWSDGDDYGQLGR